MDRCSDLIWQMKRNLEIDGRFQKRNKKRHAIGHCVTTLHVTTLTRGKRRIGRASVGLLCEGHHFLLVVSVRRGETMENDGGNSCDSPGHAIEPVLLSSNLPTFDLFITQLRRISILPFFLFPLHPPYSRIQFLVSHIIPPTTFESLRFQNPRKSFLPFPNSLLPRCAQIGHLFHPSDFLIFDLPCTVRRFLLLSDRHSVGQARRTREEKELVGRGERRQRETRRNVKCEHTSTKEGTARVERAGAIGRNLLEKGTKRKKRAIRKDEDRGQVQPETRLWRV